MRCTVFALLFALVACRKSEVASDAPPQPPPSPPPASSPAPRATAIVQSQPCLNRDEANDANCAGNPKPHFFVWDAHACAIAPNTIAEVSKHCDAIGPHLSMNPMNWCCP